MLLRARTSMESIILLSFFERLSPCNYRKLGAAEYNGVAPLLFHIADNSHKLKYIDLFARLDLTVNDVHKRPFVLFVGDLHSIEYLSATRS